MTNKFYLTTAIPYVNGRAHIGHALEYFQADTVRRYHRLLGQDTLLLSGSDENALKNVQAAEKAGLPAQDYLDKFAKIWKSAYDSMGEELDVFQRGSDQIKHWPGVQKLWQLCDANGDIYKKSYEGQYCIGCESFKAPDELTFDGLCLVHEKHTTHVKEENYFFRLSKYQDKLIKLIESNEIQIIPDNKRAETLSFIKSGLEDFSISRSKERAQGVGVPVPGDPDQVIYVWFDALNIYMTGVGFGWDEELWKKWWPADLHIIGKDIARFHTVYWPAMLLSANLPLFKQILIHDFIIINGQKMSKSLGNVVDPVELVTKYDQEPVRYYLLSQTPLGSDSDFSYERFEEVYNADLANGLGNLVARVAKLCEKHQLIANEGSPTFNPKVVEHFEDYRFNEALTFIWSQITNADKKINQQKPWELDGEDAKQVLLDLVQQIQHIAYNLQPFMPTTAQKILDQFSGPIKSGGPLFPRLWPNHFAK